MLFPNIILKKRAPDRKRAHRKEAVAKLAGTTDISKISATSQRDSRGDEAALLAIFDSKKSSFGHYKVRAGRSATHDNIFDGELSE